MNGSIRAGHSWLGRRLGVAALVVVASSCADLPQEPQLQLASMQHAEVPSAQMPVYERTFRILSDSFPGFAGLYTDQDGSVVVQLTRQENRPERAVNAAQRMLQQRQQRLGRTNVSSRVEWVSHTYVELDSWRDVLRPIVFSHRAVVSVDLNEAENRLVVGVHPGQLSQLGPVLAGLAIAEGIPEGAIAFQEDTVVQAPDTTVAGIVSGSGNVYDPVRPVAGGVY